MSKTLKDWVILGQQPVPVENIAPDAATLVSGNPTQQLENAYSSADDHFHVGIWRSEPGRWRVSYTEHEYCRLLKGLVKIHDPTGAEISLAPGDEFVIPAGFEGEWETIEACEKVYVIYQP